MNSRIIPCQVNNEYVQGSGVVVGAAGSHDDVVLRLTFNDMWTGLSKYATFRDALGENPTLVSILPHMAVLYLENTYDVPVPAAGKGREGRMMLTLSGYTTVNGTQEDTATVSTTAYFRVLPSDYSLYEDGSIDPTLAQQLQAEIDDIKEDISDARAAATEAAGSATEAAGSATEAESAKDTALAALEAFHTPTADAETLEPGEEATASYDGQDFHFGIPHGIQGEPGTDGKSAYEAAQDGGYTGTEQEFNAALSGIGDLEASVQSIEVKIPSAASSTNKLVSASEMGDAIEAVEAKQLYATSSQGSFATKAALTAATTFYNADGTVATPTKNDVAYVLADESHSGKSAKYVIASVDPIVWGFVITFSDATFTQAQMDAINSGVTSTKRAGYDTHVGNGDIHVTAAQKTAWSGKQDALPTAVLDRFLHANSVTGALEWTETPKEIALYDYQSIPGTNEIFEALQSGKIPVYVDAGVLPERGIYICCGGEYEGDDICYYFLRLAGTTVRYYKQKNLLGGEWSGSGSYDVQKALVSGTSIKTINNQPVLGSGNLAIREMPSSTTSDNGKFLRVVNGSAAWQTVPSAENSTF